MHVIFLHNSFYPEPGGIGTSIYYCAKELIKKGIKVSVITSKHKKINNCFEIYENIYVYRYSIYPLPMINFLFPCIIGNKTKKIINKILKKEDIDLIVGRSMHSTYGIIFSEYNGSVIYFPPNPVKTILKGWIDNNKKRTFKEKLLYYLHKFCMDKFYEIEKSIINSPKIKLVAALSNNVAQDLKNSYSLKKVILIPPGIDYTRFKLINDKDIILFKKKLGLKEDDIIILYVGRLEEEKNVGFLINAFNNISDNKFNLIIVGNGTKRKFYESIASKKVKFVGNIRDELLNFYNIADLFVLPSLIEGYGQTLIESLACGTPCLAFKSDNLKIRTAAEEILGGNKFCYLLEKEDHELLKEAIIKYSKVKNNNEDCKKYCEDFVKKRNNWTKFADEIINSINYGKPKN